MGADLNSVFVGIKSVITMKKGGMPLNRLPREYEEMMHEKLNYKQYGFKSLEDMISSCDTLSISMTAEGPVVSSHDEKMSHVASLVERQRPAKKSKKKNHHASVRRNLNASHVPNYYHVNHGYPSSLNVYNQFTYYPQPLPYNCNSNYNSSLTGSKSVYPKKSYDSQRSSSGSVRSQNILPHSSYNTKQPAVTKPQSPDKSITSGSMNKSVSLKYPRTACSLGAGDARFSSKSENLPKPSPPKEIILSVEVQKQNCSSTKTFREEPTEEESSFFLKMEQNVDRDSNRMPTDIHQNVKESDSTSGLNSQTEQSILVTVTDDFERSSSKAVPSLEKNLPVWDSSDSDDYSPPLMGIGRGRLKQKRPVAEKIPGGCSNFAWSDTTSQPSSILSEEDDQTRIAKYSKTQGLSITVFNPVASNPSNADDFEDWDDVEPIICSYQLIGDDIALRLAEETLDCKIKETAGVKSCGLCIEGLSIQECCMQIRNNNNISDQVVIMLGLTDILLGLSFEEMVKHTQTLLGLLKERNIMFTLLTIPSLPCLYFYPKASQTLSYFNKWLIQLRGLHYFWVLDVAPCLKSDETSNFEKLPGQPVDQLSSRGAKVLFDTICKNMV